MKRLCGGSPKRDPVLKNIKGSRNIAAHNLLFTDLLKIKLAFLILLRLKSFLFRARRKLLIQRNCCKWIWSWKFLSEKATTGYILNIPASRSALYGHVATELESVMPLLGQSRNRLTDRSLSAVKRTERNLAPNLRFQVHGKIISFQSTRGSRN